MFPWMCTQSRSIILALGKTWIPLAFSLQSKYSSENGKTFFTLRAAEKTCCEERQNKKKISTWWRRWKIFGSRIWEISQRWINIRISVTAYFLDSGAPLVKDFFKWINDDGFCWRRESEAAWIRRDNLWLSKEKS